MVLPFPDPYQVDIPNHPTDPNPGDRFSYDDTDFACHFQEKNPPKTGFLRRIDIKTDT
jgi:hypothetical protein